ncbi:hypothetical protein XGA_3024 [Xanthomonas hortorum ATCC 19865]|nr:hypothetical protein XGA_3024 [Xanthomonas hortorum ATCC 19865]
MQAFEFFALRIRRIFATQAATLVGFADQGKLCDALGAAEGIAAHQQFVHGAVAQFGQAMHVQVFAAGGDGKLAIVLRHLEAFAQGLQRGDAALLVHDVAWPFVRWCECFAQIVGERGKAHQRIARRQSRGHVADHFLVDAGIHFRMKLGALRYAVQRVDFRQDDAQCVGVVQGAQKCGGLRACQYATQLLPHAFGHQAVEFAAGGHLAHQCSGLWRDSETQRCQSCHEARCAQHAHGIFDERRAYMTQHACLQIARAAVGIE